MIFCNKTLSIQSLLYRRHLSCLLSIIAFGSLSGCGGIVGTSLSPSPTQPTQPANNDVTGNWQIAATTTSGTQPFSSLTGSMVQTAQASGASTVTSIVQAANPSSCYLGQTTIPSDGTFSGTSLSLTSFSVGGQYLGITGTSTTGSDLAGTFTITGGCANGVKGTLSGTKIASMTGTYNGTSSAASQAVMLTLTQDATADGFGYFHVQGSATFQGISCFSGGTLQSTQSTITGQQVSLVISTNGVSAATVTATGVLSPSANTLTLSSLQVTSGSCAGSQGTATLSR